MRVLGRRVLRKEDPALLVGGREYVDDLRIPGAAFVTYVRSTLAHARIVADRHVEAERAPGVLAGGDGAPDLDLNADESDAAPGSRHPIR